MSHRKMVSIVDLCTSISNISYHLNQLCVWRKIYCTQHFAYTVRESTVHSPYLCKYLSSGVEAQFSSLQLSTSDCLPHPIRTPIASPSRTQTTVNDGTEREFSAGAQPSLETSSIPWRFKTKRESRSVKHQSPSQLIAHVQETTDNRA
ncbi:predicted protein [Histoplasma capsulatum G186AR]|uniref:Uncharacterized protein n=1 Tax=Ajellomyces capsulatus (strain G186AR / H82 / ATCC MYA-2454 / RMSCC 2432) TaxID=447093 RepID=C0NET6_AJECG|nr:uncharacterized protein HCBG_01402 [Histoplasma capsulatum G186AR]EEH09757.1 predicted protein [Histoplasma capsulatum G186AR]